MNTLAGFCTEVKGTVHEFFKTSSLILVSEWIIKLEVSCEMALYVGCPDYFNVGFGVLLIPWYYYDDYTRTGEQSVDH